MMKKTIADRRCDWLALHLIPGLGNIVFKNLLERFFSPERIFQADVPRELMEVGGVRREVAEHIVSRACSEDPIRVLDHVTRLGARVTTYSDPEYPPALRQIHDPPMILYIKGRHLPPNPTLAGIVGSRNPTSYGLKAAEEIAQGLARRGIGIVSGMARGIDAAAHWGCLGGLGFTVAVLGTGIDRVYPASNRKLHAQIVEKGAVFSEFPPGTPPEPKNFPIRNRIISGMSQGIIVVEATKKSGSLITASLALDQGREVFAVPGSINSFKSTGCHFLIKQGAILIENSDDVLDGLGLNYTCVKKTDTFAEKPLPEMNESETKIYLLIGDYPIHIDQIVRESGMGPATISSLLTGMELSGIIRQLPGKMFVRHPVSRETYPR